MGHNKIISILIILLLTLSSFILTNSMPAISLKSQKLEQKKWTFMFYADADFAPNIPGLIDLIAQSMRSSENVNILVLQDSNPDPASIWYIDENHDKISVEDLGEINMGNYTSLRNFVNYCKNNYSAERYMLVLWDHGMAWEGACIEITDVPDGGDHLTMDEMQRALAESGGVNIIGFSACVMGCVESAYELRNYTEVYFGSEEMNGYNSWPWQEISQILDKNCSESGTPSIES